MSKTPYIAEINKLSSHGTEQGIIPRFVLQMLKLEEEASFPTNAPKKSYKYITVASSDFTSFYDLHEEIINKRKEYLRKLYSKKIIEIQQSGAISIDRTIETSLLQNVKDFFIKGRIMLNNWVKSEVIKDEYLDLKNLLIVKDSNFENQYQKYLSVDEYARYDHLFNLIRVGKNQFLNKFNKIRAQIEHEDLQLKYSRIELKDDEIKVNEPFLENNPMYELIDFFYENILDLIEKVMVYYYGINAFINWNGNKNLFKRDKIDFENEIYEYVILSNKERANMKKLIN